MTSLVLFLYIMDENEVMVPDGVTEVTPESNIEVQAEPTPDAVEPVDNG